MEISDTTLASALIKVKAYENSHIPDSSEIDHSFSIDFEKKMDKLIACFDEKERSVPFFKGTFAKAAVIILSLCIAAFSLAMANPKAGADFKNAVMEFYENHIKFYFITAEETSADFSSYESITAGYTPQGFTLKNTYEEYEAVGYRYENDKEGLAYDIYASLNDGLAVHTHKEGNVEEILISGRDAYLISDKNEEKPYSTLIIIGNKITVTIYGNLDTDEIIKVGQSLKEE